MTTTAATLTKFRINWLPIIWISVIHGGVLLAPFFFSWSALVICIGLYVITSFGVTMGFHRLLTHRSFQTPKVIEYLLTVLGCLTNQGGPIQWVATHRAHHAHSDEEGDPHSPNDGPWWAHMFWLTKWDPHLNTSAGHEHYAKDLAKDPVHRFLSICDVPLQIGTAVILFLLGHYWWGDQGMNWLVWGIFVRTTLTYHVTWLVNSATHMWGYRTHKTGDRSTNLWWVAILSMGEGWHNNHHAFPRSARHGLRWWEVDMTYVGIRLLSFIGLAKHIHTPTKVIRRAV